MCVSPNLSASHPAPNRSQRPSSRLRSFRIWTTPLCASAILLGCATKDLPGVMEYQEIVAQAKAEVANAVATLEKVEAQGAKVPAGITVDFSSEVVRLEVNSIQIRERVQAIQARGDVYFKDWDENISKIKNSRVRELARKHHPELEQSFNRIKAGCQRAGASFKPFLAELRTIRLKLETQSGVAPDHEQTSNTLSQGREVLQALDDVSFELQGVVKMLTPPKASNNQ